MIRIFGRVIGDCSDESVMQIQPGNLFECISKCHLILANEPREGIQWKASQYFPAEMPAMFSQVGSHYNVLHSRICYAFSLLQCLQCFPIRIASGEFNGELNRDLNEEA